jgi:hypothetical protein
MPEDGKRIDSWNAAEVGVPFDLGWGIGVWRADGMVSRTCKGCGVTVSSPVDAHGEVTRVAIRHQDGCPVWAAIQAGNNPGLS